MRFQREPRTVVISRDLLFQRHFRQRQRRTAARWNLGKERQIVANREYVPKSGTATESQGAERIGRRQARQQRAPETRAPDTVRNRLKRSTITSLGNDRSQRLRKTLDQTEPEAKCGTTGFQRAIPIAV